eukprot:Nk52_evm26s352 gene=Nk52_evmTU26s352
MSAGFVIPGSTIAVDDFTGKGGVEHFFLTHMHSENTIGLCKGWSRGLIFCSAASMKLLVLKYRIKKEYIVCMNLEVPKLLEFDDEGKKNVTVTAFDANHCLGSVMFLFEGYFGNIFCTGDFRFAEHMRTLRKLQNTTVNVLYLDNTYFSPEVYIPSREDAAVQFCSLIRKFQNKDVYVGSDNLGKEELFVRLAENLGTKLGVYEERLKVLRYFGLGKYFTSFKNSHIKLVPQKIITTEWIDFKRKESCRDVVAVIPTFLWNRKSTDAEANESGIYFVPYALHSSFKEIENFVKILSPGRIVPMMKDPNRYVHMHLEKFCLESAKGMFKVPKKPSQASKTPTVARDLKNEKESSKMPIGEQGGAIHGELTQREKKNKSCMESSDEPKKSKSENSKPVESSSENKRVRPHEKPAALRHAETKQALRTIQTPATLRYGICYKVVELLQEEANAVKKYKMFLNNKKL